MHVTNEPKWLATLRSFTFKSIFRRWWMIALFLLIGIATFAQNAIVGTGFAPGWGGACGTNTNFQYFTGGAGSSYIRTTVANGTGNQYFRLGVDWDGQRRQHTITLNTDVKVLPGLEYTLNNTCTTNGSMFIDVTNVAHNYIFKTFNATASPQYKMVYFKVEGAVRSITNVSVPVTVLAGNTATITATLDGALSAGQGVYLRYSLDAFATSTVIPMNGAGTAYTADIPGFAQGAEVKYYCFTSGSGLSGTINHALANFYTINASTNGGLNYGYTVTANPGIATIANGNWGDGSTWEGGVVPTGDFAKAIIRHAVSLNTNALLKDLDVEPSGFLSNTNRSLTIANGGSIRNKGNLNLGQGLLLFKGSGTILDSLGLAYAELEGGPVSLGGSSISGWLRLTTNGSTVGVVDPLKPPVYLDNSSLRISTGTTVSVGPEWTPTLNPFNLWIDEGSTYILCNSSPAATYLLHGGVILTDGGKLLVDPLCNGNTAQPPGPAGSINFLTITGDLNIDDGCSLTIQRGDVGSIVQGTRFQLLLKGNFNNEGDLTLSNDIGDDFYLEGNWNNYGNFDPGANASAGANPITAGDGRAVFLSGKHEQQLNYGSIFHYLNIDNPAGVILKEDVCEVSRALSFISGKINLNNRVLQVGTNYDSHILGKIYGAGENTYAYGGTIERYVSNKNQPTADDEQVAPNLGSPCLFPLGTANYYRPYTITYSAYPGDPGLLAVRHYGGSNAVTGAQPNLTDGDGTKVTQYYGNAYWQAGFTPEGISSNHGTFTASFTCTSCQVGLTNPDKIRAIRRPDAVGAWSLPGSLVATTGTNMSPTVGRSGLTGFSQFALGYDPVVLPLRLKSFTGERTVSGNRLTWVSSREENFSHFALESSPDSRNFSQIAMVNGRGGNFDQTYTHLDPKAAGLTYYRLRMVDKDGSDRYSHIVILKGDEPLAGYIAASFVKSTQSILLQHGGDGFVRGTTARLVDLNGRVLTQRTLDTSKIQYLQAGFLASGVYLVQISGPNGNETIKVMVR